MNTGELAAYFEAKSDAFNAGLEAAAKHLRDKAAKMWRPELEHGAATSNMMAMIYEAEADEILALRQLP